MNNLYLGIDNSYKGNISDIKYLVKNGDFYYDIKAKSNIKPSDYALYKYSDMVTNALKYVRYIDYLPKRYQDKFKDLSDMELLKLQRLIAIEDRKLNNHSYSGNSVKYIKHIDGFNMNEYRKIATIFNLGFDYMYKREIIESIVDKEHEQEEIKSSFKKVK